MTRIGFIGSGKMALVLMKTIIKAKFADSVISSDVSDERLKFIKTKVDVNTTKDNKEVVKKSDIIFLCVKPQDMADVLDEIKDSVDENQIFVSIAAGITIKFMESKLNAKIVRVMPNMPCLVGEMAAGYSAGSKVNKADLAKVDKILNMNGMALQVEEKDLNTITALSGSGPAFFAAFIDGMVKGAVKEGMDEETAIKLACQTALGTGKLLLEEGIAPKELIRRVATPNGTTVEGFKILDSKNLEDTLIKAIQAAARRSRELGM